MDGSDRADVVDESQASNAAPTGAGVGPPAHLVPELLPISDDQPTNPDVAHPQTTKPESRDGKSARVSQFHSFSERVRGAHPVVTGEDVGDAYTIQRTEFDPVTLARRRAYSWDVRTGLHPRELHRRATIGDTSHGIIEGEHTPQITTADTTRHVPVRYQELSLRLDRSLRPHDQKPASTAEEAIDRLKKAKEAKEYDVTEHLLAIGDLAAIIDTDINVDDPKRSKGLTSDEAARRLQLHGRNKLTPPKRLPEIVILLLKFLNPFMILLEVAAVLGFVAYAIEPGETSNLYLGIVLVVIITGTSLMAYYQERKSSDVMKGFAALFPQKCKVIRDGREDVIDSELIVVGDIITVQAGDKVPADIRVLSCSDFMVDNSSMSGECEPQPRAVDFTDHNPLETQNLAFYSTLAVDGRAIGVAVRTGDNTLIGRIAALAANQPAEVTTLQHEVNRFVKFITVVALAFGVLFFVLGLVRGMDVIPNLISTIGIIVANIPEGLPATVTVCLTLVARRLASKNVFVKKLESVETLGSTTVIVSDKTGTLTQNKMTVVHSFYDGETHDAIESTDAATTFTPMDIGGHPSCQAIIRVATICSRAVFAPPVDPSENEKKKQARAAKAAATAGTAAETAQRRPWWRRCCKRSGDPEVDIGMGVGVGKAHATEPSYVGGPGPAMEEEEEATHVDVPVGSGTRTEKAKLDIIGDASEKALLRLAEAHVDTDAVRERFPKLFEVPFNSKNKYQLSIHHYEPLLSGGAFDVTGLLDGETPPATRHLIVFKGAPEIVLERCVSHLHEGKEMPLDADAKTGILDAVEELAAMGERVLALANLWFVPGPSGDETVYKTEEGNYPTHGYVLAGLLSLKDPPRLGVPDAIATCRQAGVKIIMATGDHPLTGASIAKAIGLVTLPLSDIYTRPEGPPPLPKNYVRLKYNMTAAKLTRKEKKEKKKRDSQSAPGAVDSPSAEVDERRGWRGLWAAIVRGTRHTPPTPLPTRRMDVEAGIDETDVTDASESVAPDVPPPPPSSVAGGNDDVEEGDVGDSQGVTQTIAVDTRAPDDRNATFDSAGDARPRDAQQVELHVTEGTDGAHVETALQGQPSGVPLADDGLSRDDETVAVEGTSDAPIPAYMQSVDVHTTTTGPHTDDTGTFTLVRSIPRRASVAVVFDRPSNTVNRSGPESILPAATVGGGGAGRYDHGYVAKTSGAYPTEDMLRLLPLELRCAIVITGPTLLKMSDDQLDYALRAPEVVFARTSPQQKHRIVESLQRLGHVVAVTGDGVNDSPALKKADIGIAMGIGGSEVAKEAADIILTDDSFVSITFGILEGRLVFDNLRKSIAYTLSHLLPELVPFILAVALGFPPGLSAILILGIDLLTEMAPAISLAYEVPETEIMKRPPRDKHKDHLVNSRTLAFSYLQMGILESIPAVLLYLYVMNAHGFPPNSLLNQIDHFQKGGGAIIVDGNIKSETDQLNALNEAQSAWFMVIVTTQMVNLFACKTRESSLFQHGMFRNMRTLYGIMIAGVIMVLIIFVPFLNTVFSTRMITPAWVWLFILPYLVFLFAWAELRKWIIRRQRGQGLFCRLFFW